jgi:chromosome segregation ATPase
MLEGPLKVSGGTDEIITLLRQEVDRVTAERDTFAQRLKKEEAQDDQRLETATAKLRTRIQTLEQELEEAHKKIDTLQDEIRAQKARADAAENLTKTVQTDIESLTKRLGQMELVRMDEKKSNREEADKAVKETKDVLETELHRLRCVVLCACVHVCM